MQLGTNDDPRATDAFRQAVRATMHVAGRDRCVVWPNIVRPRVAGTSYAGYNAVLAAENRRRDNLYVVNWTRMARRHPRAGRRPSECDRIRGPCRGDRRQGPGLHRAVAAAIAGTSTRPLAGMAVAGYGRFTTSRVRQHLRSNAVAYVALFFALSGSAYALQGKNSVDSGDIRNGQVKTRDVANDTGKGALRGIDVASDTLTGSDIDEGSLGRVPSAQNAETLNGLDSAKFLPATALRSGRLTMDDPTPGDGVGPNATVLETDSVRIILQCIQNVSGGSNEEALVSIFAENSNAPISISSSDTGTPPAPVNDPNENGGFDIVDLVAGTNTVRSAHFITVAPNGHVVSGALSAELDDAQAPGSDCTFGWNLLTP